MFKDKLRKLRAEKNISQKKLAAILDVAPTAVCNWEQGTAEPRPDKLRKLAVFFDVSIDSLYEEELEKERKEKNDKKKLLDVYSLMKIIDGEFLERMKKESMKKCRDELQEHMKTCNKKSNLAFHKYCDWLKCKNLIEN